MKQIFVTKNYTGPSVLRVLVTVVLVVSEIGNGKAQDGGNPRELVKLLARDVR